MISIEFCGAAKTVTGSNYYVKTEKGAFVVDCGMFQGPEVEHLNLEPLEYDASNVQFALLTHAHIDHSGMLPKLKKAGFNGPIYATPHTIQLSTELLLDSAKLQENAYEKGEFYGRYSNIRAMVYSTKDATDTIALFKGVHLNDEFEPVQGIKVKYIEAGHILGSASIEVTIEDEGKSKKIIFSGDIGRKKSHIIDTFDPDYKAEADIVIMESLYGGEIHPDRDESAAQLVEIIKSTINQRGNVYIPSFAVQRVQEVLNDLKYAKEHGNLGKDIAVWLDSPLAQRVTAIYTAALQTTERDLFNFEGLKYVMKYRQSQKLGKTQGQVIMAGSGMADGGRIVEHLTTGLSNPKNTVIFVGFQAEGTLGREIVEGAKKVVIGKNTVAVNAKIVQLKGFSAHGDTNDYTEWLKRFLGQNLKKIYLIHAEPVRAAALKTHFETNYNLNNCYIPSMKEVVTI